MVGLERAFGVDERGVGGAGVGPAVEDTDGCDLEDGFRVAVLCAGALQIDHDQWCIRPRSGRPVSEVREPRAALTEMSAGSIGVRPSV
jgi:hypothetical protein